MITCKIGELGCILTKKILIGSIMLLLTFGLLIYRIHNLPNETLQGFHHHYEPLIPIEDTWPQFLEVCGRDKYFNTIQNQMKCHSKYMDRTVQSWKGYVIRIEDLRQSILKYLHHAVTIQVRMDPAESDFFPDLILTMDSEYADKLANKIGSIVEQLNRGSQFGFNAIIKNLGDSHTSRHFHLQSIWKEEGQKEIPPHLHDHGRYADTPSFLKGSN